MKKPTLLSRVAPLLVFTCGAIALGIHPTLAEPPTESKSKAVERDLYSIPVTTVDGVQTTLGEYKSKVLLIVNTASQCGYTPQYEGLEKLSKAYQNQGLVVLGFPSNDFGSQEPGTNAEIKRFCKLNFHIDFPLFEKASVGGKAIQPVYSWLLANAPTHDAIGWNFEKFLVSRQGKVLARFKSGVTPDSTELKNAIEQALRP